MSTEPKYNFLPWLRQGIGLQINNLDTEKPASVRGQVDVDVKITENDTVVRTVSKQVELLGAADVTGINPKVIASTNPIKGTASLEPNYLPFIEFFDEDFPWRYTPGKPPGDGKKHQPWLALVVLTKEEGTVTQSENQPLAQLEVHSSLLPDPSGLWAWAHIQSNEDFLDQTNEEVIDTLKGIQSSRAQMAFSRIMASRRLSPNTSYTAYLVPTFEVGRVVGLGQDPANLDPSAALYSWNNDPGETTYLPVYHSWEFATTDAGDFEELVTRLQPGAPDATVGIRKMDVRRPGMGVNEEGSEYSTDYIGLGGALKHAGTEGYSYIGNDETTIWNRLKDQVNESYGLLLDATTISEDPEITAPIYGRWHAMVQQLDTDNHLSTGNPEDAFWSDYLNLNFANRATAGIGAEVVRENQEFFMDRAWEQVGEIVAVNKQLVTDHVKMEIQYAAYIKHLEGLLGDRVYQATLELQRKNRAANSQKTLFQEAKESHMGTVSGSAGFQKIAKKGGRYVRPLDRQLSDSVLSVNDNYVSNLGTQTLTDIELAKTYQGSTYFLNSTAQLQELGQVVTNVLGGSASSYPVCKKGQCQNVNAFSAIDQHLESVPQLEAKAELSMQSHRDRILQSIDPEKNYKEYIAKLIKCHAPPLSLIQPVQATPHLGQAMFSYLRDKSPDFILPNISKISNNMITLLETNPAFIDAYMVGLNHEMNRELLWREFPTDLRGTPFKQFWNTKDYYAPGLEDDGSLDDAKPIHEWAYETTLGDASHSGSVAEAGRNLSTSGNVAVLIRGDIFKRYPNTRIYAVNAYFDGNITKPYSSEHPNLQIKYPIFQGGIDPDIRFFGFELTLTQALGDADTDAGWYFIMEERVGDIRFGLDVSTDGNYDSWNKLAWPSLGVDPGEFIPTGTPPTPVPAQLEGITYGDSSADMAYILMQQPARIYVHARKLLEDL